MDPMTGTLEESLFDTRKQPFPEAGGLDVKIPACTRVFDAGENLDMADHLLPPIDPAGAPQGVYPGVGSRVERSWE
jgi:hypothetical protein